MYVVLRTIRMNCPICNKTHNVEERLGDVATIYNGVKIRYAERFYACTNEKYENEFVTKTMVSENVKAARAAYIQSLSEQ